MIISTRTVTILVAFLCSTVLINFGPTQAQMPLPVYVAPTPVVKVHRPIFHHRAYYAPVIPVQVNYPAYYAPQVPVVPMASGPVSTMSAYYVPTAPVAQTYYVPAPVKKLRRRSVAVFPVVVQPVYWLP